MPSLKDRLAQAMKLRKTSVHTLTEATGISRGSIYFILDGTTKAENIRAVTLDKIARALSVNREWLLYGHGRLDAVLGEMSSLTSLAEAVRLMRTDEQLGGSYPPERHAHLLLDLASRLASGEQPQELASWLAYQRREA